MPNIFIPTMLRDLTTGLDQVEVEAATVAEAIAALDQKFPGVEGRLCQGSRLTPGIQVSIDHVMSNRGLRAKVLPHSEIHFLPALGGG
jgi:sulfur-carrier protein